MGQDYSYSQPSSSSNFVDITSLLEAEGQMYADEAESSYIISLVWSLAMYHLLFVSSLSKLDLCSCVFSEML
ncbi:hypothetical protein YC2023_036069 [Brassica napus]|uniref:Uncharacterized protein n=1 Tax=Brassica cretica TaxID=69181 RepID=A0ABQ7DJ27_BRACR|nr:hypothetical protein DY000_02031723 [Brassica cretica]